MLYTMKSADTRAHRQGSHLLRYSAISQKALSSYLALLHAML